MGGRLVLGEGPSRAASFSRFVLPFAYQLTPGQSLSTTRGWKPAELPNAKSRRHYLTPETAHVLFERARWFRLEAEPDGSLKEAFPATFPRSIGGETLTVEVDSPWLVLFEYGGAQTPAAPDVLRTGFVILDARLRAGSDGSKPTLDHLLDFNERFRCWRYSFPDHARKYAELLANCPLDGSGDMFLSRWMPYLRVPVLDNHEAPAALFPQDWNRRASEYISTGLSAEGNSGWLVHADNRTYVWTCALLDGGAKALASSYDLPGGRPDLFGHWVKLLNVDSASDSLGPTHDTTAFERRWARDHTYTRWAESGSWYGFSYHSGAMIGDPGPPFWEHFRDMYFDAALLLLYLRVTTFRFSRLLSGVSENLRNARDLRDIAEQQSAMRRDFAVFTNLYRYPLLSNQQQGVEMYSLARRCMDVDELFTEVEKEIEATNAYLSGTEERKHVALTAQLTWWLAVLTIALTFGTVVTLGILTEEAVWRWWTEGSHAPGGPARQVTRGLSWVMFWLVFIALVIRYVPRWRWIRRLVDPEYQR